MCGLRYDGVHLSADLTHPISADQVCKVLGSGTVAELAKKAGIRGYARFLYAMRR
jgi:uncharacterized protein YidB (DUF937 family)